MDLLRVVEYLYPNLIDLTDYIVEDNWNWAELNWLNTEIIKPTQEELNVGWTSYQNKKVISEKITKIRELKREIRSYSWAITNLNNVEFDAIEVYEISKLKIEYNTLKTELDTYDQVIVESILNPDNIDYSLYWEEEEEEQSSGASIITWGIILWGSNTIPEGYLVCYWQLVSKTTYADLFTVIWTNYWSSSDTEFTVPNLNWRVPAWKGSSEYISSKFNALWRMEWEETCNLWISNMPSHNHSYTRVYESSWWTSGWGWSWMRASSYNTSSKWSWSAHNNLQPFCVFNFIIKT